ncbi:flavin-containing monooxygenase [Streptomyces syringium]|uniref:flavin-containing monooxygenase n=1 Tax=Streptomyces syringium TaxID=76729 RepID=UPI003456E4CD
MPVIVVGAGPSGLSTAAMLRRVGVSAVVLERSAAVGEHWRGQYEHLALHTTRGLSALPGLRVPRQAGRWVGRDDWADYLKRYAAHHRLDIRANTVVTRVSPAGQNSDGAWEVMTNRERFVARSVVFAAGRNRLPHIPKWPGAATFDGHLLHSRDYRSPERYAGLAVLVVGAGNSGTEIAVALSQAGADRVWLSVRTPPTIVPRSTSRWQAAGIWAHRLPPAFGDRATALVQRLSLPDLTRHGLPQPAEGLYTRNLRHDVSPVHDRGIVEAVRSGAIEPVPAVTACDGPRVVLADGTELTPDVVIAATGYRTGLEHLLGPLPVIDRTGRPFVTGPRTAPQAPGLYFAGYTNPLSGALRQCGIDARAIARAIHRAHRSPRPRLPRPRTEKAAQSA